MVFNWGQESLLSSEGMRDCSLEVKTGQWSFPIVGEAIAPARTRFPLPLNYVGKEELRAKGDKTWKTSRKHRVFTGTGTSLMFKASRFCAATIFVSERRAWKACHARGK